MGWDSPPLMQPRSHQAMQAIPAGPAHRAERETAWVAGCLVWVVGALGCLCMPSPPGRKEEEHRGEKESKEWVGFLVGSWLG